MKKLVSEALGDILKPKSKEDVTNEIKRRLDGKDLDIIKETPEYVIYQSKKADDFKDVIRNFGGRDEDIFFNFYLILDNSVSGFKQVIGIKVSPPDGTTDGNINAVDAKGNKVENSYLGKFS